MEAALIGLAGVVVVQFGLLWYRIGRVEGLLNEHCRRNGEEVRRGRRGKYRSEEGDDGE